jgi:hypothetical protein
MVDVASIVFPKITMQRDLQKVFGSYKKREPLSGV